MRFNMCLATPLKVKKIQKDSAIVESNHNHKHQHKVNISLLKNKNLKVGDYVLIHQNMAIHKLNKKEALEMIKASKV